MKSKTFIILFIMKKTSILLFFLFGVYIVHAQTVNTVCNGVENDYFPEMRSMMQLRDGGILACCQLFEMDENYAYVADYGNRFLKLTKQENGWAVTDSVELLNEDLCYYLMERNPFDNVNIFAEVLRDSISSILHIAFFDDSLRFYPKKERFVPIEDTAIDCLSQRFLLNPDGDIVLRYSTEEAKHKFVQVGLDGTLKYTATIPNEQLLMGRKTEEVVVFSETPLKYCYWGVEWVNGDEFHCYILDSLFNVENELYIDNYTTLEDHWEFCGRDKVWATPEGDLMVAAQFYMPLHAIDGTIVGRFDLTNHTQTGEIRFASDPLGQIGNMLYGCAYPIGLEIQDDGYVYYSYCTQDMVVAGWVSVVKMDLDFNIIWQRYCLGPDYFLGEQMTLLEEGGVAIGGVYTIPPPRNFFVFIDDHGVGTPESEAFIRPYAFWPNPAHDQLCLQYSPDVQPTQIEFYDLQGRLVRTQTTSFESLSMEGLAVGQYVLKITLENGKVYTDKVVKE